MAFATQIDAKFSIIFFPSIPYWIRRSKSTELRLEWLRSHAVIWFHSKFSAGFQHHFFSILYTLPIICDGDQSFMCLYFVCTVYPNTKYDMRTIIIIIMDNMSAWTKRKILQFNSFILVFLWCTFYVCGFHRHTGTHNWNRRNEIVNYDWEAKINVYINSFISR